VASLCPRDEKEITHRQKDDLDDMDEKQLAIEHVRVAQLLLASYEEDEETDFGCVLGEPCLTLRIAMLAALKSI
jgi:hypothetical protein